MAPRAGKQVQRRRRALGGPRRGGLSPLPVLAALPGPGPLRGEDERRALGLGEGCPASQRWRAAVGGAQGSSEAAGVAPCHVGTERGRAEAASSEQPLSPGDVFSPRPRRGVCRSGCAASSWSFSDLEGLWEQASRRAALWPRVSRGLSLRPSRGLVGAGCFFVTGSL